jgi:hypothetical protein
MLTCPLPLEARARAQVSWIYRKIGDILYLTSFLPSARPSVPPSIDPSIHPNVPPSVRPSILLADSLMVYLKISPLRCIEPISSACLTTLCVPAQEPCRLSDSV